MEKANLGHYLQGDPYLHQKQKLTIEDSEGLPAEFKSIYGEGVSGTTCINVVDSVGNMVSATPSGPNGWETPVMGDTGILMNARMRQFIFDKSVNPHNVVEPGKRPRTTLSPTIVLKNGKPFIALSTPGTDLQEQSLLQVLLNILTFDMNPQEAVEAARFETLHMFASGTTILIEEGAVKLEGRFPEESIEELKNRGHKTTVVGDYANNTGVTVVMFNPQTGSISGGADVRRDRHAIGW